MFESLENRMMFMISAQETSPGWIEMVAFPNPDTGEVRAELRFDGPGMFVITDQTTGEVQEFAGILGGSYLGSPGSDFITAIVPEVTMCQLYIFGGDGDDELKGVQNASVYGGPGSDRLTIKDSWMQSIVGGDGDDMMILEGDNADPWITGDDGDDYITAAGGTIGNYFSGGSGNDTIVGTSSDYDIINGGDGYDRAIKIEGYADLLGIEVLNGRVVWRPAGK